MAYLNYNTDKNGIRVPKKNHFFALLKSFMKTRYDSVALNPRYDAKRTISNSNSISILGIPSTDSRHNGKCNICAFRGEIHAFQEWIFVRLSSLVLASEWTTNRKKFIYFDRFMTSECSYTLILPFTYKRGNL